MGRIAVLVVCLFVLSASASATTQQDLNYYGIHCETNHRTQSVLCVPRKGYGYGVSISRTVILVLHYNIDGTSSATLLKAQP